MLDALALPFIQRALLAGVLASIACGVVGSFVVVKRMASISGGLSHAAFGGVGLGFLLHFNPLIGAAIFALGCGVGITFAYRRLQDGLDTLIAMVWSVGMALGIVFVSLAPGYAPDLMSYLFGSILFVPSDFVYATLALDVVLLLVVVLLYKDLQAVAFDEEFTEVAGMPTELVFQILMALTALTIVVLIRVVGVILVIALLSIPAATARQWSDSLKSMMVIAALIGAACAAGGLFASYGLSESLDVNMPTGPLIILLAAAVFGISSTIGLVKRQGR